MADFIDFLLGRQGKLLQHSFPQAATHTYSVVSLQKARMYLNTINRIKERFFPPSCCVCIVGSLAPSGGAK